MHDVTNVLVNEPEAALVADDESLNSIAASPNVIMSDEAQALPLIQATVSQN